MQGFTWFGLTVWQQESPQGCLRARKLECPGPAQQNNKTAKQAGSCRTVVEQQSHCNEAEMGDWGRWAPVECSRSALSTPFILNRLQSHWTLQPQSGWFCLPSGGENIPNITAHISQAYAKVGFANLLDISKSTQVNIPWLMVTVLLYQLHDKIYLLKPY